MIRGLFASLVGRPQADTPVMAPGSGPLVGKLAQLETAFAPALPARPRSPRKSVDVQAAKLLIIDDELSTILIVQKCLTVAGYRNIVILTESEMALETIVQENPDVVLLDLVMPGVGGLEILTRLRALEQMAHLPVIIITSSEDEAVRNKALELGATDLLTKPIRATDLLPRVRNALTLKQHHDCLQRYTHELEQHVQRRTAELANSRAELIHCLARVAEYRDNRSGRHAQRVGRYAGILARRLGLEEATVDLLEAAAPLHDLGKIAVPEAILLKPGKLAPEEFEAMQRHAAAGERMLEPLTPDEWRVYRKHTLMGEMLMDSPSSPLISLAAEIALTHHEKWDGSGYPHGLKGEKIPLSGRIVGVADAFDALSSKRPYKAALPPEQCLAIMEEGRGTHFDPRVLDALLASQEEILHTHSECADLE
jgi:putative two-component system response regulator